MLFDQQYADPASRSLPYQLRTPVNVLRLQSLARLVKNPQRTRVSRGSRNSEHFLLTTRKRARALRRTLGEKRETFGRGLF
ncbi:unannotated protein [freshwater metagenome]|uniref:Unannotated protein n=1 Tax=freshwater metagenome TaxID=449393 RepID=A0A6J7FAX5_9ZZZZ